MTLRELQHGLSLEPGDSEFDEDAVTIPDILTSVCAGLVIIDKSTGTTRFYHYSAQEYFRTSLGRGSLQSKRFPDLQKDMAVASLTYLSLDEFAVEGDLSEAARKARVGEYPFLKYAVQYWSLHAGHVPEGDFGIFGLTLCASSRMTKTTGLPSQKPWALCTNVQ